MKNFIIGISGKKRCGKDSLCNALIKYLGSKNILAKRYAFADELKKELDPLFLLNAGISAFTEDPVEKELVRHVLIAYGTGFWREKDPDHWVKKVDAAIKNDSRPHVAIITDDRFPNESQWVKDNGGILIHIERLDLNNRPMPAAGRDEELNDPIIKAASDYQLLWPTFGESEEVFLQETKRVSDDLFFGYYKQWQESFPIN